MKTPVLFIWASSLILALTLLPDAQAQNDALPPPAAASAPTSNLVSAPLSRASAEIVKLAAAGIETNVLLNFIATSGVFDLNSEQINRLAALGVSAPIITAMIQHDQLLAVRAPAALAADEAGAISTPAPPESTNLQPGETTDAATSLGLAPIETATTTAAPAELKNPPAAVPSIVPSPKTPVLYPVREPYPVELTAPIIFVRAPEIVPNTVVIIGFPPAVRPTERR